ncbi:uncharacterized protein [Nicotiana sylvestris]|uniref:uncharacterized protein n=1 Tax=Nicotiana sylvestris TaxID=4096 RepID=UPI00388CE0BA
MVFENVRQFRFALQNYVVHRRVQLKLKTSERNRVRAICLNSSRCRWHILGSLQGHTQHFIVNTYYPVHLCFPVIKNKLANTTWIVKHYKDKIINQSDIKLKKLQELIRIKYGVYVGKTICVRARQKVIGSTIVVRTLKEIELGKEVFVRIYICLHTLKTGWLEGRRDVIRFDGAFLKGVCKSELLSCIAKDGNNQMYHVAWAVVEKETKNSWS